MVISQSPLDGRCLGLRWTLRFGNLGLNLLQLILNRCDHGRRGWKDLTESLRRFSDDLQKLHQLAHLLTTGRTTGRPPLREPPAASVVAEWPSLRTLPADGACDGPFCGRLLCSIALKPP